MALPIGKITDAIDNHKNGNSLTTLCSDGFTIPLKKFNNDDISYEGNVLTISNDKIKKVIDLQSITCVDEIILLNPTTDEG